MHQGLIYCKKYFCSGDNLQRCSNYHPFLKEVCTDHIVRDNGSPNTSMEEQNPSSQLALDGDIKRIFTLESLTRDNTELLKIN